MYFISIICTTRYLPTRVKSLFMFTPQPYLSILRSIELLRDLQKPYLFYKYVIKKKWLLTYLLRQHHFGQLVLVVAASYLVLTIESIKFCIFNFETKNCIRSYTDTVKLHRIYGIAVF